MFLALALAALTEAPRVGRVAVVTVPFVLPVETARELSPTASERLTFQIGGQSASALDPFAKSEARASLFQLDMNVARPGDDPTFAPRIAAAQCIVLEGGNWLDWWFALRPYGKQSELCRALVRAHARGIHLVGIGPAGAHLAGRSLLSRATLHRPNRDPHARSIDVLLGGIGVSSDLCIDFATDGRVDPERMLEALFDRDLERGVWLAGPCAWIEDANTQTASTVGPSGAAFVFDARSSRRSREQIEDVALTRLVDGSRIDLANRAAQSNTVPTSREETSTGPGGEAGPGKLAGFFDLPGENTWISGKPLTLRGERHVLRLAFDSPSNADRSGPGPNAPDRARLAWLPLER
ncbi:MAG: hypothetical protein SGI72_18000 [Planctomycetota bacterium]|nr:hypothetical protein [Planctomycetota bacterium]